ncbi:ComEC/Rec2 family competence protein [Bacteroides neonati]|uniref:MBL fold metallo-hydrolase n=1 Tax=Bacteroides neonati TaxID=1347393 RepID=UPI0004B994D3|nr:MBL fold metallo-hydrolase [Bacteroides neonati]
MLYIRFLSVGCADGIHIRYYGIDNKWHNILIDGGRNSTYHSKVKPILEEIISNDECIDIWIISHIDDDHIGALLYALEHDIAAIKKCISTNTKMFYNHNIDDDYTLNCDNGELKSVPQGIKLVEFLSNNRISVINNITNDSDEVKHYGANIRFLSPCRKYYADFLEKWHSNQIKKDRKKDIEYKAAQQSDYKIPYSCLIHGHFEEDRSVWNKSSIACLFRFLGYDFIFSADASPITICESLQQLGYSSVNKLDVEFMQLPHHGSKYNISNELLEIINCNNYVVSANGVNNHCLPNKEAISRVIYTNRHKQANIFLTDNTKELREMFAYEADENVRKTQFYFRNTDILISLQNGKIIYSTGQHKQ